MPTLDWSSHQCLIKCSPYFHAKNYENIKKIKRLKKVEIKFDDISHAYKIMAHIVTIYGDKYLPIFERLHQEILNQKSKKELRNIAFNMTNTKLPSE